LDATPSQETCLVTGVAGFLGSHVADHCREHGLNVIGLDDMSGGFVQNVPDHVTFYEGSIMDVPLIEKIFATHKIAYVYHLAAYAAEGLSHFIRRFNYNNNLIGSVNLINESIKQDVKCFVFTSSIAVYGAAQTPMSESTKPEPEDPYGVAKYAVELDLRAAREIFGLNSIVFRPHNVYGERQNLADRYRNVIGIFMNQIMDGKPMTIFGDGLQTRAFSHIVDVAPTIARSVFEPEAYNETFNVGADTPYSVLELSHTVARALGVEPQVIHLDPRLEVLHAYADHEKARSIFGTSDPLSLEEGVRRMAEWARRQQRMEPSTFGEIEVEKNMPRSWRRPERSA
jgi:UDP-glucose 4-epimerase